MKNSNERNESNESMFLSALLTFLIGAIAGIAPFIFMQLLPVLLNPGLQINPPDYSAMIWTAVLIGAITAIIFTKTFKSSDPKDIFFYALGIPAILIATVSNVSTKFDAAGQISQVKENSSSTVLSSPMAETFKSEPVLLKPPPEIKQESALFNTAWAAQLEGRIDLAAATGNYLVVIGEFLSEDEAWAAYKKFDKERLRTETYVSKNLSVYKFDTDRYVLVYGRYDDPLYAEKVFKLLKINDPNINVRLLRLDTRK